MVSLVQPLVGGYGKDDLTVGSHGAEGADTAI
jgi:hypothetical protein